MNVRRGFTLLELLILMALTALLLGILTPGLAQSRISARNVECMSNLRQIGTMHFDPLSRRDSWGRSAYDLPPGEEGRNEAVGGNGGGGYGPGTPPIRRVEGENRVPDRTRQINRLEAQAPDIPPYWKLLCPEAVSEGQNSYGMYYRVVGQRFSVYSTSVDIIFGCSDFKVVDVAQSFAFRHHQKANFYFGDHHLDSRNSALFTEAQWSEQSFRGGPDPGN